MRKACGTRFRAGREAAARPESVPGLGMHGSFSGLLEGGRPGVPQGPPLAPRSPEACGTRWPEQSGGCAAASGQPAPRPGSEGGKEGETQFSKHLGKDEGGSGKLAASSRSRLRSPSFILPEIISFTENICLHY